MKKVLIGAALGAGVLAFTAGGASAEMACNGSVCWHAKEHYEYPPSAGVVVHEDAWKPGPNITIREHEGRGYWKGDRWNAW